MDNVQTAEELLALNELCKDYENQLKTSGFDLSSLDSEAVQCLEEYAKLKCSLKLNDISLTSLDELYINKKRKELEYSDIIFKLKTDISKLEKQIEKEDASMKKLESFVHSFEKRSLSKEEIERNTLKIEGEIKVLRAKLESFTEDDIDLDEIISKLDKIKASDKNKN